MLDVPIKIPKQYYDMLAGLLSTGKLQHDGFTLDLSEVQNIKIADGKLEFNPPAKIKASIGPVNIKTTITTITAGSTGININIDNSPVDVEVRPA